MTAYELKQRYPHASESFIKANADTDYTGSSAIVERAAGDEPLEAHQGQASAAGRLHIRFVSARKHLLDPDNLSVKWMLDCLRYCRIINGDEPEKISLEVTQRKCAKGESEHTVIEIYE